MSPMLVHLVNVIKYHCHYFNCGVLFKRFFFFLNLQKNTFIVVQYHCSNLAFAVIHMFSIQIL